MRVCLSDVPLWSFSSQFGPSLPHVDPVLSHVIIETVAHLFPKQT